MKTVILLLALGAIVAALGSAGWFMLRRPPEPPHGTDPAQAAAQRGRMARALAWRVALSVGLFVCILLASALGWITPGGLPLAR